MTKSSACANALTFGLVPRRISVWSSAAICKPNSVLRTVNWESMVVGLWVENVWNMSKSNVEIRKGTPAAGRSGSVALKIAICSLAICAPNCRKASRM